MTFAFWVAQADTASGGDALERFVYTLAQGLAQGSIYALVALGFLAVALWIAVTQHGDSSTTAAELPLGVPEVRRSITMAGVAAAVASYVGLAALQTAAAMRVLVAVNDPERILRTRGQQEIVSPDLILDDVEHHVRAIGI